MPRPFDPATATAEELAASVPLTNYMQGHGKDDSSLMEKAFLQTAHIESIPDGQFTSLERDVYRQRFKNNTPAADEATRKRTIDWIDVHGSAGAAKVTLVHGANTFIDYFVLLKTAEGWKIANKTFHAEPTA